MDEIDINYLIGNNRWVAVYPSNNGIWKAFIYRKYVTKTKDKRWKVEYSTKTKTPKECYDWIETIFYDLKGLKDIK